jgi:hypothetical protein
MKISWFHHKRFLITAIVVLLLLIAEGTFDILEITAGEWMRLTNAWRPRTGRLWEEESKDSAGRVQMEQWREQVVTSDSITETGIQSFDDLIALLSARRTIALKRDDFIKIYRSLSKEMAEKWIDPSTVYELSRNQDWSTVHFTLQSRQLGTLFLDRYRQYLYDRYVPLDFFFASLPESGFSVLETREPYAGRVVSASDFFSAFDHLAPELRRLLVPDMYQLIQWGDRLERVGISRYAVHDSVRLAFEIRLQNQVRTVEMKAPKTIVNSFISKLNTTGLNSPLMTVIEKEDQDD